MATRPSSGKTAYSLLGVAVDATQAQIDAGYERMRREYAAVELMLNKSERLAQLTTAYEMLSNPVRRSVYDKSMAVGATQSLLVASEGSRPGSAAEASLGKSGPPWAKIAIGVGVCLAIPLLLSQMLVFYEKRKALRAYQVTLAASREWMKSEEAKALNRELDERLEQRRSVGGADNWQEASEARQRERDMDHWKSQAEANQRREQYAEQLDKSYAEQEKHKQEYAEANARARAEEDREQERRTAQARVDGERLALMDKLLREYRFAEARQIAKDTRELQRIDEAERR